MTRVYRRLTGPIGYGQGHDRLSGERATGERRTLGNPVTGSTAGQKPPWVTVGLGSRPRPPVGRAERTSLPTDESALDRPLAQAPSGEGEQGHRHREVADDGRDDRAGLDRGHPRRPAEEHRAGEEVPVALAPQPSV